MQTPHATFHRYAYRTPLLMGVLLWVAPLHAAEHGSPSQDRDQQRLLARYSDEAQQQLRSTIGFRQAGDLGGAIASLRKGIESARIALGPYDLGLGELHILLAGYCFMNEEYKAALVATNAALEVCKKNRLEENDPRVVQANDLDATIRRFVQTHP